MEVITADMILALREFVIGPGGALGMLVLYQFWRIYNLSRVASKLYDDNLMYRERTARAEAWREARQQIRGHCDESE